MREIIFTEAEVQAIGHERYHHPDPRVQRHFEVLWLKHYDFTHERIATLAGCSRRTVQRILSAYIEGGLESIRQVHVQEGRSELDEHRGCLEEFFTKEPPRSVKQARQIIEERTGVRRGLTQVRHFLHRLGLARARWPPSRFHPTPRCPTTSRARRSFSKRSWNLGWRKRGRASE